MATLDTTTGTVTCEGCGMPLVVAEPNSSEAPNVVAHDACGHYTPITVPGAEAGAPAAAKTTRRRLQKPRRTSSTEAPVSDDPAQAAVSDDTAGESPAAEQGTGVEAADTVAASTSTDDSSTN